MSVTLSGMMGCSNVNVIVIERMRPTMKFHNDNEAGFSSLSPVPAITTDSRHPQKAPIEIIITARIVVVVEKHSLFSAFVM